MLLTLDKPVLVEVAYPGHEPERFTFTHLDPSTKTYYTTNRAAHISQNTLDQIRKGGYQWLKEVFIASEGS